MKEMTKSDLQKWCSNYSNCYYVWINECLMNTGECPYLCDEIARSIGNSRVFKDVTELAAEFHPQLEHEVVRNGCRLYMVLDGDKCIVISYFNHNG